MRRFSVTEDVRESVPEELSAAKIAIQLGASIVVSAAILPILLWISGLGRDSAYEFAISRGDIESGLRLGVAYAIAQGFLLFVAGYLCLARVARGRFVLPRWGAAIVVALVVGLAFVALFLSGLGDLGGPQPVPPEAQQFGRTLGDIYPAVSTLTVAGLLVTMLFLRQYDNRAVRMLSYFLPGLIAAATTATLLYLTLAAHALHL
ncbi:asparagine N-glycosylation enzyme membrane subunit Stt3 [Conyzicola nivalis]|uniref:Asparagine N-glycosylation enzyme membrane subunit Stt3 n=1 Tax=Conyzicola nivalis TaxID=1477021 RepID=A0ABV2QRQ7_9MICO